MEFTEMLEKLKEQRAGWAGMSTDGERFTVPRDGKKGVDVLLYRPEDSNGSLPVMFNMHGGAWIGGDAVLLETFCRRLANEIPCFVVNVNYTKADVECYPYAIDEVVDSVKYFMEHACEYGLDTGRFAVGGHSAGAQIAAGAALKLKDEGIKLACQMLVYPTTDLFSRSELSPLLDMYFGNGGAREPYASPLFASDTALDGVCPAIFIECGLDSLRDQGIAYAKRLMNIGVSVKVKEYRRALHGFLEVNRPDYDPDDPRRTPEQDMYCKDCEKYLINELRANFQDV